MSTTTIARPNRKLSRHVVRRALEIVRELKAADAAYEAEVDAWYRSGDGRPSHWIDRPVFGATGEILGFEHVNVGGRGYAFPHCRHGSSRWTSYDNICGGCEDDTSLYELALARAKRDVEKYHDRVTNVVKLASDRDLPQNIREQLTDWLADIRP